MQVRHLCGRAGEKAPVVVCGRAVVAGSEHHLRVERETRQKPPAAAGGVEDGDR